jgi:TIR domain
MYVKTLQAFISYSHNDGVLKDVFLECLKHEFDYLRIPVAIDGDLIAGTNWKCQLTKAQEDSPIQILLISSSYLGSINCLAEYNIAFSMLAANEARIIPIILEDCDWRTGLAPDNTQVIDSLHALPVLDGRIMPFNKYGQDDRILSQIGKEIRKSVIDFMQRVNHSDINNHKETLEQFIAEDRTEDAKVKLLEFARQFGCSETIIRRTTLVASDCAMLQTTGITIRELIQIKREIYTEMLAIMEAAITDLKQVIITPLRKAV